MVTIKVLPKENDEKFPSVIDNANHEHDIHEHHGRPDDGVEDVVVVHGHPDHAGDHIDQNHDHSKEHHNLSGRVILV